MSTPADNPLETDAPRKKSWKKWAWLAVKLLVTVGLMGWVVAQVDWPEFWTQLKNISLVLVLIVIVLRFLGVWISAVKWQQLLLIHKVDYPWTRLLRWYLVSLFLSQFLPSIIGGDAYRVYKTYRNETARVVSLLAIFNERASGMAALLLMGYIGAIFSYLRTGNEFSGLVVIAGSIGLAVAIIGCAVVFGFGLMGKIADLKWCPKPIKSLIRYSGDYRHHPGRIAVAAIISFGFHLNRVFVIWLLLYGLGVTVDFGELIIAAAVVNLVGVMPISLAGWGLVEASFIGVMKLYGVDATAALTTMLLMRVLILPVAAIGAYFYFRGDAVDAPPPKPAVVGGSA